jgi:fructose-1,6-bisphosphatase
VRFYNYALADKERCSYLYIPYYKHYKLDSLSSFDKKNISGYIKKNFPRLIKKIYLISKKVQLKKLDDSNIKFQFINQFNQINNELISISYFNNLTLNKD